MRETLSTFQRRLSHGCIPRDLLKPLLRFMLTGLDYLHTQCHIIHTGNFVLDIKTYIKLTKSDLKPDNILIGLEDERIVHELIQEEQKNPSSVKIYNESRIYPHRNFGDLRGVPGRPKLGDFGLAISSSQHVYNHPIQPDCLRAPEVILRAGWSYSADIWNLGVMVRALSILDSQAHMIFFFAGLGFVGRPITFRYLES